MKPLRIFIQKCVRKLQTPTKQQFQTWAQAAIASPLPSAEVTIRIVGIAESAILNEKYRNKTGATNVLSFAYAAIPGEASTSLGDLVICAELVKQEAEAENKTVLERWAHLTVHGLLHLQGYDHIEKPAAQAMEQLETQILQSLGFADPYQNMEKD